MTRSNQTEIQIRDQLLILESTNADLVVGRVSLGGFQNFLICELRKTAAEQQPKLEHGLRRREENPQTAKAVSFPGFNVESLHLMCICSLKFVV